MLANDRPRPHQLEDLSRPPADLASITTLKRAIPWCYAPDGKGGWTKKPRGLWTKPENWRSFAEVAKLVHDGAADGVGVVLSPDWSIAAIDIDNCCPYGQDNSKPLSSWAEPIITAAGSCYIEYTVGGKGLRIIGTTARQVSIDRKIKGIEQSDGSLKIVPKPPKGSPGFEIFCRSTNRYITVSARGTGDPLASIDQVIDLLQQLYPQPSKPATAPAEPSWRLRPNDPPDQVDADTMARITGPLSEQDAADRSAAFHGIVSALLHANHSIDEIVALMESHPGGAAQRYIAEGRLPKMVELSFNKFRGESKERQRDTGEEQYFVVKIEGQTLIGELRPALRLMKVQDFRTWLANKRITHRGPRGGIKSIPLSEIWLTDPRRRQFEGVDLVPGGKEVLPNGYFNLWRGFGVQPKQGEWPLMMRHVIYVLAAGNRNAAEYILRWASWAVQHPGELAEVALVLRGGKGSGKGVFGNALVRIFGEHALHITNEDHLTGRFNGHLRACLFLFVDDALWAGDKKGESVLKGLITERSLTIEQKGIDAGPWTNRLHLLIAGNNEWLVPASHDERRYAVFDVSDRYTKSGADADKSKAYFDALHRELETGGLEAMMYDLMNWDLGDWHPRQVYESDGLRKQKDLSMKPLDQWWDAFLEEGTLPLRPPGAPLTFVPTKHLIADAIDRVPYLRNRLGEKEIGIFLERQGCDRLKGRRTASARGWTLLPLREHQERWEQRYGKREWEVREWQSLYDRMTSNKVSPGIDKLLK